MTAQACQTDYDCPEMQHCNINTSDNSKTCVTTQSGDNKCYRSSDCTTDGSWCRKPGETETSCISCSDYNDDSSNNQLITMRTCKCGSSKYCKTCSSTDSTKCDLCVAGAEKLQQDGACIPLCSATTPSSDVCKCGSGSCGVGFICIGEGSEVACQKPSNPCAFDKNCSSCNDDQTKCTTCNDGYKADSDGLCQLKETCLQGTTMVENCSKCQAANETQCSECIYGYQLSSNQCAEKPCSELLPYCSYCYRHDNTVSCVTCDKGYGSDNEKDCVKRENPCEVDKDCTSTQYCNIIQQQCLSFTPSDTSCYKTSECQSNNTVCAFPGSSKKDSCETCANYIGLAYVRGCKCGTAENCAQCNASDPSKCSDCIEGYSLNASGVCALACVDDQILSSECACYGSTCQKGEVCTATNGCVPESETDSCRRGPSEISYCIECEPDDSKKCKKCSSDYSVVENKCVNETSCNAENCKYCIAGETEACETCNSGFYAYMGACLAETCLEGPTTVDNCQKCYAAKPTWCQTCKDGYVSSFGRCIAYDDSNWCYNDWYCDMQTEVCDTVNYQCVKYNQNDDYCYVSSQCAENGQICGNPGETRKDNCGKCEDYPLIANKKGCKCGDSQYCAECDSTDSSKCGKCISSYSLVATTGECVETCQIGVHGFDRCYCNGEVCEKNHTCLILNGVKKCVDESTGSCLEGDYKVPNCTLCYPVSPLKCKGCADGYILNNPLNICEKIDDCTYGDKKIDNCETCGTDDIFTCQKCKKGFSLSNNKCKAKQANTGLIIGIVVACAVVILVAIAVAVVVIRKRKSNGAVITVFQKNDRTRELKGDEVHIPV